MNPLNYASLEASKRLIEVVVLETEFVWVYAQHIPLKGTDRTWKLFDRHSLMAIEATEQRPDCLIPAPSIAEVWRELPEGTELVKCRDISAAWFMDGELQSDDHQNTNPTDALIDLLIWVKKEEI